MMHGLVNTLAFVVRHPLNEAHRASALARFVRWQVGSRLVPGAVAVPFVDSTRLLVGPGMTGATQNIYCGLQEFEDMAFVLHALRPNDLFVDVGANVGSYTVLAAGAAGADCVAIEPGPAAFAHLVDNIRLNDLGAKVTVRNIGVAGSSGSLRFTSGLDTENHVAARDEAAAGSIDVLVDPLDAVLSGTTPVVMKIDVEGFETEVLNGAPETMQQDSLLAVVMELNGSGLRYGYDDQRIHERMLRWGFTAARYTPRNRAIIALDTRHRAAGNTLYVRGMDRVRERVRTAPPHKVLGAIL